MAQHIKVFAVQDWWPQFAPWNQLKVNREENKQTKKQNI